MGEDQLTASIDAGRALTAAAAVTEAEALAQELGESGSSGKPIRTY